MEFKNGKRDSGGATVAVFSVGVEGAGYWGESGKGSTVWRTCQGVNKTAPVRHAVGVDARGIDAVVGFEVVYQVAREQLVVNAGRWVEFSFPGSLAALES